MDKTLLRRYYSRCAPVYDRYAKIQEEVGRRLLEGLKDKEACRVLEIGCGTGFYTRLLRERFPGAQIVAVDISGEMVAMASNRLEKKGVRFVVGDAEELAWRGPFDLVTSNACVHWFENFPQTLLRLKSALAKEGSVAFSFYGPKTFWELKDSLALMDPRASIPAQNFMAPPVLKKFLEDHFSESVMVEKTYRETFATLRDLLASIKGTGASSGGGFLKPGFLKSWERVYEERFGGFRLTHQVLFCYGAA